MEFLSPSLRNRIAKIANEIKNELELNRLTRHVRNKVGEAVKTVIINGNAEILNEKERRRIDSVKTYVEKVVTFANDCEGDVLQHFTAASKNLQNSNTFKDNFKIAVEGNEIEGILTRKGQSVSNGRNVLHNILVAKIVEKNKTGTNYHKKLTKKGVLKIKHLMDALNEWMIVYPRKIPVMAIAECRMNDIVEIASELRFIPVCPITLKEMENKLGLNDENCNGLLILKDGLDTETDDNFIFF